MWFTLPLDVIWKHHMGERHWTLPRLVAHTFVIQWAVFFLAMLAFPNWIIPQTAKQQYREAIALCGFLAVVWIFGLANLWEIHQRRKAGIQWHTQYWGTPRLLPNKPIVRCLIIPIGSGLIAYGFYRLFPPLGVYLFVMAGAQFVDATDTYRTKRLEKLNRSDREIDMEIKTAEWEDRQRGSLDLVRLAPPLRPMRTPEHERQFQTRWKNVLKPSDSEKA